MNQEVVNILKEIKSEEHLAILLPSKINEKLKRVGLNLFEICQLTETDFLRFEGLGKSKYIYLKEFVNEISSNPSMITSFKKHILNPPIELPSNFNTSKSIAINIYNAIVELTQHLKEREQLPSIFFGKIEYNSYNVLFQYISYYFGLNNHEVLNLKDIGVKYGKTPESIRSNLFDYPNRPDLIDLFLKNEVGFGIKINPLLISECNETIKSYLYKPNFIENFVYEEDDLSENQIEHILDVFDCELVNIEIVDSDFIYKTIVNKSKNEVLEFKAYFRVFDSMFREGNKYNLVNLKTEFVKKTEELPNRIYNKLIKANGFNEQMFMSVIENYFKLEKINEDEEIIYQYKWQYLSSQNAKITRILFENGTIMTKEEIFEEFQTREDKLGIEYSMESIDYLFIKKSNFIHPLGKSGSWFYDENFTKEKNSLAERVSHDISKTFNGLIQYDTFIEFTSKIEFYNHYEKSAIRTNIFLCCRPTTQDKNIFIHNDFIDRYPQYELMANRNKYLTNSIAKLLIEIFVNNEDEFEKNKLCNLIVEKLSEKNIEVKTKHNIYQYLDKFSELGILNFIKENNAVYVQLDREELKNHDIETLGKKQEPFYKKNIRTSAVTFLKEKVKVKLSDLFVHVKPLAPLDIAKNNIYKIFNDDSIFIKEKIENDIWISLNTALLPVPQEMHVEVEEVTTELLGTTPLPKRLLYNTTELKKAIIEELLSEKNTYGLSQEIIFKNFESLIEIVLNNDRNSIWGRTLIQSVYESFCTKTDFFDRHMCVMNLIGSYETFLKILSPITQHGRVTGIVEIINSIPEIKDLYQYKNQERFKITDKHKNNFSHILNKVKYLADLYRHDRTHEDLSMGNSKMMKSIVDFTALYLYTLYLTNKNN